MEFRLGFFYGDVGSSMVWFSSSGYWVVFFYVVVYGSSGGSIMWVLGWVLSMWWCMVLLVVPSCGS